MTDRDKFARAQGRVTALKAFYIHLFAYASVVIALSLVNLLAGGDWWVQWVFFGWGIGIVAHALAVFARTPRAVAAWEKRKLRQLIER